MQLGETKAAHPLLDDPDPRVRVRIAQALALAGDDKGFEALIAATAFRELTFLDDPWGAREMKRIAQTFGELAKDRFEWLGDEGLAELERMRAWAAEHCGRPIELPAVQADRPATGGIEFRSCRYGDLFVRWHDGDTEPLSFGLLGDSNTAVTAQGLDELLATLPTALGSHDGKIGKIVCDYARLQCDGAPDEGERRRRHLQSAPAMLPATIAQWIESLAADLEATSPDSDYGAAIRRRLSQFAAK